MTIGKLPPNAQPNTLAPNQGVGSTANVNKAGGQGQVGNVTIPDPTYVPQTIAQNPLNPEQSLRRSGGGNMGFVTTASAKMDADWTDLKPETQRWLQQLGQSDDATLNALFDDLLSDRVWS